MRILVLTDLYPPVMLGGYERACANVVDALIARGHAVTVLTTWSHLPENDPPAHVRRQLDLRYLGSTPIPDARITDLILHEANCSHYTNTTQLIAALRDDPPDVVYVWNLLGIGGAALLDILNIVDVPWVMHLMDAVPDYVKANAPPYILSVFRARGPTLYEKGRMIAMSENLLDEIATRAGIRFSPPAVIIPGWADVTHVRPHGPYRDGGIVRFVTAGRVAIHKGVDVILEASRLLRAEGIKDFTVDIFGEGDVFDFVASASRAGLVETLRFNGPRNQPELFAEFARFDAFLFPTMDREPFGFAPIEAAACGVMPILTANCGASERLVDNVHCLKIERSADDLARAMRAVVLGEVDCEQIGLRAQRMVRTDLEFQTIVSQIEAILEGARRPWNLETSRDPKLPLLAFLKHNLALTMRYGWS